MIALMEFLEYRRQAFRRDARSGVLDGYLQLAVDWSCGHRHLSPFGGELDGVAEQIPQYLQHAFRIQPRRWKRRADSGLQNNFFGFHERSDFGNRPPNQRIKVNGLA